MNIVIYGFMGVGKTTTGKLTSRRLGYKFIDMDKLIETREEKSISEIFRKNGERYFRKLEKELVEELAAEDRLVIACGGGVVADPVNAETLAESGFMVYLWAGLNEIKRTSQDNTRPLLDVDDPGNTAMRLMQQREPVYESYADIRIDTSNLTPDEVVDRIIEALK